MQKEYDALIKNGTWRLVDPPIGMKQIGSKWVYKTKYKAGGSLDKYKEILVAKGYAQKVLITQKHLLLLQNGALLELCFLLQLKMDGKYIIWM